MVSSFLLSHRERLNRFKFRYGNVLRPIVEGDLYWHADFHGLGSAADDVGHHLWSFVERDQRHDVWHIAGERLGHWTIDNGVRQNLRTPRGLDPVYFVTHTCGAIETRIKLMVAARGALLDMEFVFFTPVPVGLGLFGGN